MMKISKIIFLFILSFYQINIYACSVGEGTSLDSDTIFKNNINYHLSENHKFALVKVGRQSVTEESVIDEIHIGNVIQQWADISEKEILLRHGITSCTLIILAPKLEGVMALEKIDDKYVPRGLWLTNDKNFTKLIKLLNNHNG
jgi:hypothetical protein